MKIDRLKTSAMANPLWYKTAIIYNLDVMTFKDSDGDGIGDFRGLMQGLDYLESLGVNTIWLAPFYPSPRKDDGYDVADFTRVDPRLGSDADFDAFMQETQKRGLRVMMDLVIDHTSDEHPWFQEAIRDANAPHHNWYVWSKERPEDSYAGMVFPNVEKEIWTYVEAVDAYYYHRFYSSEPTLNTKNPDVQKNDEEIIRLWLGRGISGFRVDGVPFLIEEPKKGYRTPPRDHNLLTHFRKFIHNINPDAVMLGEANILPKALSDYFGPDGCRLQMIFNFYVNQYLFFSLATGEIGSLTKALRASQEIPEASQWAVFLRNHDELDLGRLSWLERERVFYEFGPDKEMQLYDRGIRRRLAPMLGNDRRRLELAYSLNFSLPGTPVLHYGEELGMGDDLNLHERLSVRTPMQWSGEPNAGFSSGKPFRPVIDGGDYGYHNLNVAQATDEPHSLLNWIRHVIELRQQCPEIALGAYEILDAHSAHVLGMLYEHEGHRLLTLHNLCGEAQDFNVQLGDYGVFKDLFHPEQMLTPNDGNYKGHLQPYGYRWYRSSKP